MGLQEQTCKTNKIKNNCSRVVAHRPITVVSFKFNLNPLDARRRLTDFSQTSYAAGSRLTYKTVNQCSGS